jgi:hypothetical protein
VLAEIVAIGQKRGEIRRDIPALHVARAVQQEIFGAFLLWALDPELELSTWLDTSVNLVFFGIVGRGRDGVRATAMEERRAPEKDAFGRLKDLRRGFVFKNTAKRRFVKREKQ